MEPGVETHFVLWMIILGLQEIFQGIFSALWNSPAPPPHYIEYALSYSDEQNGNSFGDMLLLKVYAAILYPRQQVQIPVRLPTVKTEDFSGYSELSR